MGIRSPSGLNTWYFLFSAIVWKASAENSRPTSSQCDALRRIVSLLVTRFRDAHGQYTTPILDYVASQ